MNLVARIIEIYREPHFSGYAWPRVLGPGEKAAPLAFPDVGVEVGELLNLLFCSSGTV